MQRYIAVVMKIAVKVPKQKASVYQSVTRQNAVNLTPILFAVQFTASLSSIANYYTGTGTTTSPPDVDYEEASECYEQNTDYSPNQDFHRQKINTLSECMALCRIWKYLGRYDYALYTLVRGYDEYVQSW